MSTPREIRMARRTAQAMAYGQDLRETAPDDPEEFESLQPLDEAQVMVCYVVASGAVCVTGARINADRVSEEYFAQRVLNRWAAAIERERESDRASAFECAQERAAA